MHTGFQGTLCDYNPDNCIGVVCDHGSCVDGLDNFTCQCQPGYTGLYCDVDIDECRSQPCQNQGTCVDLLGSYDCVCPGGTDGQ